MRDSKNVDNDDNDGDDDDDDDDDRRIDTRKLSPMIQIIRENYHRSYKRY